MSDRQRIPVLVGEVRLADTCKLPSGGGIPGEEALLIALKRLSSSWLQHGGLRAAFRALVGVHLRGRELGAWAGWEYAGAGGLRVWIGR
jgi:hypothetical protein